MLQSPDGGRRDLAAARAAGPRARARDGASSLGSPASSISTTPTRSAPRSARRSRRARPLVVDMAEVEFVDSTALGVLIEARSKLGSDGLRLAAPQLETRRTLQVSGLDRHLPVHDSVDEALA